MRSISKIMPRCPFFDSVLARDRIVLPSCSYQIVEEKLIMEGNIQIIEMELEDKTIAIIASNEFEDIELEYPLLNFSERGADVILVPVRAGLHPRPSLESTDVKPVTGRYGSPLPPDVLPEGDRYVTKTLDELSVDEIDCVMYPGGFSPDHLRIHDGVIEFTKEAHDAGKIIAAICHGPWVLISADLVEGKTVTGYDAVHDDLENAGANLQVVPAVQDGQIVTGQIPNTLPQFCDAVVEAVANLEEPPSEPVIADD